MVENPVVVEQTQRERIEAALDVVRPAIRRDGGDVWLVRVEGSTALVQMVGACGGCAMIGATLRDLVEATVTERCPDIRAVRHV